MGGSLLAVFSYCNYSWGTRLYALKNECWGVGTDEGRGAVNKQHLNTFHMCSVLSSHTKTIVTCPNPPSRGTDLNPASFNCSGTSPVSFGEVSSTGRLAWLLSRIARSSYKPKGGMTNPSETRIFFALPSGDGEPACRLRRKTARATSLIATLGITRRYCTVAYTVMVGQYRRAFRVVLQWIVPDFHVAQ